MPKEKHPPFMLIVVQMKKPYGILFLEKPTNKQVMETFADAIGILTKKGQINEYFEVLRFDITEDIEETIAEINPQ